MTDASGHERASREVQLEAPLASSGTPQVALSGAPLFDPGAGPGALPAAIPAGAGAPRVGQGVHAVGIDAVDIRRFRRVLARRPGVAERLFTQAELDRAGRRADRVPTLAARFAAKEATMKALGVGVGGIDWHDVELAAAGSGAPVLVVTGRASALADAAGVGRWHVSLTHTDTLALATVVVETRSCCPGGEMPAITDQGPSRDVPRTGGEGITDHATADAIRTGGEGITDHETADAIRTGRGGEPCCQS